jgi:hypothetical protein
MYRLAAGPNPSNAFGDGMKRCANADLQVISSDERMESMRTTADTGRYIRQANGARLG